MKRGIASTLRLMLGTVGVLVAAASSRAAVDLYLSDLNALPTGTIVRPPMDSPYFFEFHGDTGVTFSDEITAADGVAGSKSFRQNISAAGAPYFYAGFGQFAVDASNMPVGVDSNNSAMYRFSADVKVTGNSTNTPLTFGIAVADPVYESQHNIDVNADGDFLDGATVYEPNVIPTITTPGVYTNVSFTLNQGTLLPTDPDVLLADRVFSRWTSFVWYANYNNGGFGLDAGNTVSIDNVRIEFLGQPALHGDYNGDGIVDALDYTVWRNNVGAASMTNEGASQGTVDNADYEEWRSHYGDPIPAGGGGIGTATPEPTSALLIAWGILGLLLSRIVRR